MLPTYKEHNSIRISRATRNKKKLPDTYVAKLFIYMMQIKGFQVISSTWTLVPTLNRLVCHIMRQEKKIIQLEGQWSKGYIKVSISICRDKLS